MPILMHCFVSGRDGTGVSIALIAENMNRSICRDEPLEQCVRKRWDIFSKAKVRFRKVTMIPVIGADDIRIRGGIKSNIFFLVTPPPTFSREQFPDDE